MKYIYLIKAETELGEEFYKIGITKRLVEDRIKELQTGNPCLLSLIYKFKTNIGTPVENALHRTYNINNLNGEWFSLTKNQIDNFLNECEKIEKHFLLLEQQNSWYQQKKSKNF